MQRVLASRVEPFCVLSHVWPRAVCVGLVAMTRGLVAVFMQVPAGELQSFAEAPPN